MGGVRGRTSESGERLTLRLEGRALGHAAGATRAESSASVGAALARLATPMLVQTAAVARRVSRHAREPWGALWAIVSFEEVSSHQLFLDMFGRWPLHTHGRTESTYFIVGSH